MSLKGLTDSVKIIAWFTDRVEQVSKWAKDKLKDHNEKTVDKIVDDLSDSDVEQLIVRINQARERRRNKS